MNINWNSYSIPVIIFRNILITTEEVKKIILDVVKKFIFNVVGETGKKILKDN